MKKNILLLLVLVMAFFVPQEAHAETLASTIVSDAESYVGKLPYVYGGTSLTTGADCSGFICAIYEKHGYNLWAYRTNLRGMPSTIATGVTNNINYALPGDIFTMDSNGQKHVGIYAGNGYLINAANAKQGVVKKPYTYYGSLYAITRINGVVQTFPNNNPTDTTAPTISDVSVTDKGTDGYTVTCRVEDAGGVAKVQFPTWTTYGDQDDLMASWWDSASCRGTQDGAIWRYRVNVGDHNNEEGFYNTHIYAWDAAGNSSYVHVNGIYVDRTPPVISDVQVADMDATGYTVTCKVEDASNEIAKVQFPTWTDADSQDDLSKGTNFNTK